MDLFTPNPDAPWTPVQLARAARRVMESGIGPIWVRGEITGLKAYASGHWYFTVSDRLAQVRCVMWRKYTQRLKTPPADGTQVYLLGTPTVWEERGEFRLNVTQLLVTDRIGAQQLALERIREALAKDGLFDPSRKRPLPPSPAAIAVVTSLEGAALRDIIHVAERRWPAVRIYVFGARVQGSEAEGDILRALARVNRMPDLDLCVLARGGGAKEDLAVFNSEAVCRALAAVEVPTVSAVGHETDLSLTDLIADVRAATPSAAMELVLPDQVEFARQIAGCGIRLGTALGRSTRLGRERLERSADRLQAALDQRLERRRQQLERLGAQLDALSPLKVLDRGYSVARNGQGQVLKQLSSFSPGLDFTLRVADGEVPARVRESA
ncbi:MAG: exodeoxyribonuclease VII large subunit [Gemmatimonadales bacterium]